MSDNYFNERPKGSQAGAWISDQRKEIDSREHLEQMHKDSLEKS